jgi:glucose-induced degradation protein 4
MGQPDADDETLDTPTRLVRTSRQSTSSSDLSPLDTKHHQRREVVSRHPLHLALESRFRANSSSSFLRPGARFSGIQSSSEAQRYDVTVEIQFVDMENSFLCGYLNIQKLAAAHPILTTYFEGEIIGSKYGFVTQHPEWKADKDKDMEHWSLFPGFISHQREAKKPGYTNKDWQNKEFLWMRWKEYFLVPDHRVTSLAGASFEGFYYICFNQKHGEIQGIYYHMNSPPYVCLYLELADGDRYQKLQLHPKETRGCSYSLEFR